MIRIILATALLLAGCAQEKSGGLPTPVDPGSAPSGTPASPVGTPTSTTPTVPTPKPRTLVHIVTGRFGNDPAVRGLRIRYPVYFQALVSRDTGTLSAQFPAYFFADVSADIEEARESGWVMRPPGSLVVKQVERQPGGVVRISSCRSQSTQYWNPKARRWVISAPQGSPDVIDMIHRGSGWTMYRWRKPVPKPFSCAGTRYPA